MKDDLLVPPDLLDRARKIKLFLMDIDGTLTDGGVCLLSLPNDRSGEARVAELKVFNSLDGVGLNLAHTMGIKTGFITGRRSPAVSQRAKECHVDFVHLGQATKTEAFEESMRTAQVNADQVAYMGDDLPDMAVAQRVGLAVAVANAAPELKAICHYQTKTPRRKRNRTRGDRTHPEGTGEMGRSNPPSPGLTVHTVRPRSPKGLLIQSSCGSKQKDRGARLNCTPAIQAIQPMGRLCV